MNKATSLLLLLLSLATYSFAQNASSQTFISGISIVDVEKGSTFKADVLVRDGMITDIGENLVVNDLAAVVDGKGKFLMPGLVDAHIHLFQTGGLYTRPDALDLQALHPYPEEREWARENAPDFLKRYLAAGITTVIDMGGPLYNLEIRDTYSNTEEYPNLLITGPLISTYQPEAFQIEDAPIIEVEDAKEAVDLVRKQLPAKPDFIKIWYIARKDEDADASYDIVKATIEESHANGLKVAVHATQLYTAKLAVKAGADILVHSIDDPIDDDFIDLLVKKQIAYVPTLIVHGNYLKAFHQAKGFTKADFALSSPIPLGSLLDPHHLQDNPTLAAYKNFAGKQLPALAAQDSIRLSNLKRLNDKGALIATGTDAGNIGTLHASSYFTEIDFMKASGMSNADILKASTINGAKVLGHASHRGAVEKGMVADLLVLNANPLEDLAALQNPARILKGGKWHTPGNIIQNSPEFLAQQQLNAYNAGDIEGFLAPYAEDVELYNFPNELTAKGKDKMRPGYANMFKSLPNLHCELVQRDVMGNTVIDHERITGIPNTETFDAIAIYKIEDGKIAKVYFIRE